MFLQGEVAVNRRLDTKSYTSLHALVNGMFPLTNSSEQVYLRENFFSFSFFLTLLLALRGKWGELFSCPLCDMNLLIAFMKLWYYQRFVCDATFLFGATVAQNWLQEDFNSWNFWRLPPPVIDIWMAPWLLLPDHLNLDRHVCRFCCF